MRASNSVSALRQLVRLDRIGRLMSNPWRRRWLRWQRSQHVGPKILANSIPKAGTYLLERCLSLFPDCVPFHRGVYIYGLPGRQGLEKRSRSLKLMGGGCFAQAHLQHSDIAAGILGALELKHILIVRDPRDVILSHIRFQMSRSDLPQHTVLHSLPDDETRIRRVLLGDLTRTFNYVDFGEHCSRFLRWRQHGCLLVRFEDLVGPNGGGGQENQISTVERIAEFIEVELRERQRDHVVAHLFNPESRTFRSGVIGQWRQSFSDKNKELAQELMGGLLNELGYD